jgi:hypothetical protein
MKQYTFQVHYPDNRYIECYARNKGEAIIIAQAERIRTARSYLNYTEVKCEFDHGWETV